MFCSIDPALVTVQHRFKVFQLLKDVGFVLDVCVCYLYVYTPVLFESFFVLFCDIFLLFQL